MGADRCHAVHPDFVENLQQSVRQLARHHSKVPRTLRSLVKEDLGMESRVIVQHPLLTPNAQEMRKERTRSYPIS
jgi:hypothetical protein